MRIHRSAHARFFTTLGNDVLRDNRLSYCARGILCYLLSLPDGQRGDIRTLAERTPEGRERVASALRELERFGYLKRAVSRTAEGRLYTEVDVFDRAEGSSPQAEPNAGFPGSGRLAARAGGDHPVNERGEESTRPAPPAEEEKAGRAGCSEEEAQRSSALLERVARLEPKLALGRRETLLLAPLVAEWLRRGASDPHVIGALTAGLPRCGVHHPARFVETRLRAKMPAERSIAPARAECDECRAPLAPMAESGLCKACRHRAFVGASPSADSAPPRSRGAALARAALRGLSIEAVRPAPA